MGLPIALTVNLTVAFLDFQEKSDVVLRDKQLFLQSLASRDLFANDRGADGRNGAGDDAAANGSGLGSAKGSANLTCLLFGPPRGVPLPPRPLTIVPF